MKLRDLLALADSLRDLPDAALDLPLVMSSRECQEIELEGVSVSFVDEDGESADDTKDANRAVLSLAGGLEIIAH